MVSEIENHVKSKPVDETVIKVRDWATRATLDIIGLSGMGQDFGALRNPDNRLNQQYRRVFPEEEDNIVRIFKAIVMNFDMHFFILLPLPRNREISKASQYIRSVARQAIRRKKEKIANGEDRTVDILSVALESGDFTEEGLVDQMMTFLAAGHETIAAALQWAVYALCKYPGVQSRLRKEIRSNLAPVSGNNSISFPPQQVVIDGLPYLNAVCNEVLRYWPPIQFTFRQAVNDTTILGEFIPKGTHLILSPEATNRSSMLWGPDAGQFNPDRWLNDGKVNSTGGAKNNYANMTFIHGSRSCIGQSFARSELACLVTLRVGRFEMEFKGGNVPEETIVTGTAAPKDGVVARLKVLDVW
jgi:cytochrome P450